MPKRPTLETTAFASAAVARPDPVEAATKPVLDPQPAAKQGTTSREGKVPIQGYFPKETRRRLKTLAADQERTLEDLLGEGLDDLLAKYDVDAY